MYGRQQQEFLQAMGFTLYQLPSGRGTATQAGDGHWNTPLGRNILRQLAGMPAPALAWPANPASAEGKRGLWRQVRTLQRAR